MGPKQSFARAYELCEELADAARHEIARVAFGRLTGAMIPTAVSEIEALTRRRGYSLWRSSWDWDGLARLQSLAEVLGTDEVGRGPLRRIPELLLSPEVDAGSAPVELYRRALSVLGKRAPEARKTLVAAMAALGVAEPEARFDANGYVPLLDAHVLTRLLAGRAA